MSNPEIGTMVATCGYSSNVIDEGVGKPIMLLHGSGPGVTAYANWRGIIPLLTPSRRVLAPDLAGFGHTTHPPRDFRYLDSWIEQLEAILDQLEIETTSLAGNSFGGAVALAFADRFPDRVDQLVLMGSGGAPTQLTRELDELWGYQPGRENMERLLSTMVFDQSKISDELIDLRLAATERNDVPGTLDHLFPAPRQRWLDACVLPETRMCALQHRALVVHGAQDRIIPVEASKTLVAWLPNAELHLIEQCGHWVMMEKPHIFGQLILDFLADGS